MSIFDKFRKKKASGKRFPPVPDWRPDILQPIASIVDRVKYYTNGAKDFAIFKYGTCVILDDGLSEDEAHRIAKQVLFEIYNYHPDMNPLNMDDGNILVRYNHPAVNVVLQDHVSQHWDTIDSNHQRALTQDEVLITPLGNNVFDEFGKKALFGRCFMFMDAQCIEVAQVVRKAI